MDTKYLLFLGGLTAFKTEGIHVNNLKMGSILLLLLNNRHFEKNQSDNKQSPIVGGLTAFKKGSKHHCRMAYCLEVRQLSPYYRK